MSKKNSTATEPKLTIKDVKDLGRMLIDVSDHYPLVFRTERDFYPLVRSFVWGRWTKLHVEFQTASGRIDFKIGSVNPAYLELVVRPRKLVEPDGDSISKAHDSGELYGSANKAEIKKLGELKAPSVKGRFLLLLDLKKTPQDFDKLQATYLGKKQSKVGAIVNVVYVNRRMEAEAFKVKPSS